MHERSKHALVGYGAAVLAPALTLLVCWPVRSLVTDRLIYMAFLPAVMAAAYLGGLVPGMVATAVGALTTTYFLVEPFDSLQVRSIGDVAGPTLFVFVGLMVSGVSEALHRTRRRLVAGERLRAKVALQESEEHFRQLAENIREIFWITDARGEKVIYVSPGYEEVWGRSLQSFREQPGSWRESIHPEDRDQAIKHVAQPGSGELWVQEYRVVRPDGSLRWIRGRTFPILGEDGRLSRIAGLAEDITERKQAEEAAREAQSRLEMAIRGAHIGIWELEAPDGVFEHGHSHYMNLWEMLGYDGPEIPATSAERMDLVHPDDREGLLRLVKSNLSGEIAELRSEHRVRHRDGSYRWVLARAETVPDAQGRPWRQVGVMVDITDLKRAEEELRDNERRFRTFVDNATDAFFLFDDQARVVDVNIAACESLGYKRDELVGMTPFDFDPGESAAGLEDLVGKLGGGDTIAFETRHRRKDGTVFPVEVRGRPFSEGGRAFAVTTARDITDRKQAEEALRESEERFRGTFENAAVGIAHVDRAGRFLRVNEKLCDIFGYPRSELLEMSFRDVTHPEDLAVSLEHFLPLMRGELLSYTLEKRYLRKDGLLVWGNVTVSLQHCEAGEHVYAIALLQDISERKKVEEKLRRASERLELALRSSNVALGEMDLTAGPHGRPEWLNYWEQWGTGNPEDYPTAASMRSLVHPEDRNEVSRLSDAYFRGEVSEFKSIHRVRHRDGSYHWALAQGMLFRDAQGRPIRSSGSVIDINELKRTEENLRESEERFRGTFENAAVGIAHKQATGRFLRVNAKFCDIVGYTREELLTRTWQDITYDGDLAASLEHYSSLMQGESTSFSLEKRYLRKDHSLAWVEVSVSLQCDAAGSPAYAIAIVQDISERKRLAGELRRAKEAAEAANRAKDEFLANVSHEIRTPMNAILGMTELALDTPLADQPREYLKTVQSAADSLLSILNDVLDFSKIEAGKLELDVADFSLRRALGITVRTLANRAHKKGLELISDVEADVPDALIGDAARLRQVLLNLVGNAIKFTEAGEVLVRVEAAELPAPDGEACVRFKVRDTGIGIPRDKQETIFRAFEQQDLSTTRRYGGTGLGLTIAARLVAMMGGTITVESEPDRGSTFAFTARFGLQPQTPAPVADRPPAPLHNLPVLIVDDNATNRRILEEWLKSWHMAPSAVGYGLAALDALWQAAAAGRPYPLLLLDARMPDTDGLTLAATIRERADLSATRIILLTSVPAAGAFDHVRDVRIDAQLLKPLQQGELLETIYRVMSRDQANHRAADRPARAHEIPPAPASLHILVAEDNEFNAQLLEQLLFRRGHRVRIATNGREALALTEVEAFDLLLLDLHMPEVDGFQVVRAIRERELTSGKHLPVIALTARSRKEDREICLATGMDDFLSKPIRGAELWAAIDRLVVSQTTAGEAGRTLLNARVLWEVCGGDAGVLQRICGAFRTGMPSHLEAVQDALRIQDAPRLREAAHKLNGMLAAFSTVAGGVASDLEDHAARGNLDEAGPLFQQLEAMACALLRLAASLSLENLRQQVQAEGNALG